MPPAPDLEIRRTADRRLARSLLLEAVAILHSAPSEARLRNARGRWVPLWTPARAIAAIQGFYDRHLRVPTGEEWRHASAHGLPGNSTTLRFFGSTSALVRAAGLTPVPKRNGPLARPRQEAL